MTPSPIPITSTLGVGVDRLNVLIMGASGAGKTTMCGTTGDPERTLILSAEAGLLPLRGHDIPKVQVKTFDDLRKMFVWIRANASIYRWLCLDSLSEIAENCLREELKANKDGRRAYGEMQANVVALVRGFRDLPLHVVMVAGLERVQDDTGRLVFGPLMPGKQLPGKLGYLFDLALTIHVAKDEEGKPFRWVQTGLSESHYAKDRSGSLEFAEPPDLSLIAAKILGGTPPTVQE